MTSGNYNFSFTGTSLGNVSITTVSKNPRCKCGAKTRLRRVRGFEMGWPVYRCERCDVTERLQESLKQARRIPRLFAAWLRLL